MTKYIAIGAGVIIFMLSVSLYFAGVAYLGERDRRVELAHTLDINELTREKKEEKEAAVLEVQIASDAAILELTNYHQEKESEYKIELLNARERATQKPLEFGDGLIRELIRIDCLRNMGQAGNSLEGRTACSRKASQADTAIPGLSFSVITPEFLTGWRDACEDWPRVGTGSGDLAYSQEDWIEEYGNFDPALCRETLVGLTPEFSIWLKSFVLTDSRYQQELLNHIDEQESIINILTKRGSEPDDKQDQDK